MHPWYTGKVVLWLAPFQDVDEATPRARLSMTVDTALVAACVPVAVRDLDQVARGPVAVNNCRKKGVAWMAILSLTAFPAATLPWPSTTQALSSLPVWDLESEYPNAAAWIAAEDAVAHDLSVVDRTRGQPLRAAGDLVTLMDTVASARGRAGRMARFALLKSSVNGLSNEARAQYGAAAALEARVESSVSWVDAAVRKLGEERVNAWRRQDPRLDMHAWRFAAIFRTLSHADPEGSEALAAALERSEQTPLDAYRALLTSDIGWPSITTSRGTAKVDFLAYPELRRDPKRQVRDEVNRAYFQRLKVLEEPLGLLLVRRYEADQARAKSRHFENGIDAFLFLDDGIPVGTFRRIYLNARAHRNTSVRYLKAYGRMNGLERPNLGDLYTPPRTMAASFAPNEVLGKVVSSWAPAGPRYQALLSDRLRQPWLDLAPNPEKDASAGGVYWGVGGGHPYVMLKFLGDLPSSESLAAAAALTMFYADIPADKRPERREEDFPVYSNAIWFTGELLYEDYLLSQTHIKEQRIPILASQLYRLWNAYFQYAVTTELAEKIASAVDRNAPLNGRAISAQYLDLLRAYYADPAIDIDPLFAEQWMSFPFIFDARHILPEWAVAMAAAVDLTTRIEAQDSRALTTIRAPLAMRNSFVSYDLMRDAGTVIDSDAPYVELIRKMNSDLEQLESELAH
jgi:oligoendopeptidase F